jgi:hypothetical protein
MQLRVLEEKFRDEVANKLNIKVVGLIYTSEEKCLDGKIASNLPSLGTYPVVSGSAHACSLISHRHVSASPRNLL